MTRKASSTFVPRSTTRLERGHYWSIPLPSGQFGAGCVVGRAVREGKTSPRLFLAGVIEWISNAPPRSEDLFGREIYRLGFAHIKAITESGGEILGKAQLQFRSLPLESASDEIPTWGYGVPVVLASMLAGGRS